MNNLYEEDAKDRGELNNSLDKFNWGAFGFTFIWAPFNGAWNDFWPILVIMIFFTILGNCFLGLLFFILNLLLCIYCGKKGNEWAWYGKEWKSLEHFETVQKKWATGFVIVLLVNIIITFLLMFLGLFVAKTFSNPKTQGKVFSSILIAPLTEDPEFKSAENTEAIVDLYVKNWNQSTTSKTVAKKYSEDSLLIYDPTGSSTDNLLTFYKSDECSMAKKNCYMIYQEKHGDTITPITKTYFDFNGKTFVINLKK